ncbi:hypothetical protein FH972_023902 [Carpinus fangiana]|uniref:phosphoadenylyl-sulfate reductase (thioredoxin) n=1 Tax=Carpinus fangiana TaxID=176857 RepID=A0A5N6KX61_9ROSI|nr:hypothetical protein FH972_023902 [Carpinus fangiana]
MATVQNTVAFASLSSVFPLNRRTRKGRLQLVGSDNASTHSSSMYSPSSSSRRSSDLESGYASADSSHVALNDVFFSRPHLKHINQMLSKLPTEDILKWCLITLPGLYQETAFGLSGLVTIDMLSKLDSPIKPEVDLVFMDTLHHFEETLDLVERVRTQYPNTKLHVYKPREASTADEFAEKYGEKLWESNEELYDYTAKVEPSERAFHDLGVKAVFTGRRRVQGAARKNLDIVEVTDTGLIKVNPLAGWTFEQVQDYIKQNNVPYNVLLDRGYKSVGDWHSTQPVAAGEDERAGRWKGREKTECGIHNPKSKYAQFLMEQQQQEEEAARQRGESAVSVVDSGVEVSS